jgi:hypothetical protein
MGNDATIAARLPFSWVAMSASPDPTSTPNSTRNSVSPCRSATRNFTALTCALTFVYYIYNQPNIHPVSHIIKPCTWCWNPYHFYPTRNNSPLYEIQKLQNSCSRMERIKAFTTQWYLTVFAIDSSVRNVYSRTCATNGLKSLLHHLLMLVIHPPTR